MTPKPALQDLGADRLQLVKLVVRHCLMPHHTSIQAFSGPVFPTIRDQKKRLSVAEIDGKKLMLDDNVTARWALLWAHGIKDSAHLKGWTFAHVWARPKDPTCYTHLANLCMMPEFFGSLSDKEGPLADYLKYHAWEHYQWSPDGTQPQKPPEYDEIEWRYLSPIEDPKGFVAQRLHALDNQRTRLLRDITRT